MDDAGECAGLSVGRHLWKPRVSDLVNTRATLFAGAEERDALRRMLGDEKQES
jgi:hypothetical protein